MSLSLGARWPEGRSSSYVSQILPSCSGSACQMAVKSKDVIRVICVFDYFSSSAFAAFEVRFTKRIICTFTKLLVCMLILCTLTVVCTLSQILPCACKSFRH